MKSEELKQFRKENNLDTLELAGILGVSRSCISLWESGKRDIPKSTIKLIKVYKMFPHLIGAF
jgi:DNA-binding transcriptional regulator YiaG